jgi:hypothetical protein
MLETINKVKKTNTVKGINMLYNKKKLKGIKKCIIKSFVFYYNNYCLTHQEAKYGASY